MVRFQDPSPLKWSKHSLQWHPDGSALGNAGGGGNASPLPQRCTLLAHKEATLPCVSCCDGYRLRHRCCSHSNHRCCLHCCPHCHRCWPSPLLSPSSIPVAVTIGHHHCRCRCHCRCHHHCNRCLPSPLPSPSATIVAIAVGHHCRRRRWPLLLSLPSLSPLPLPFEQLKQIMLTLFYLVCAVSGALIAADDWPEVRWQWALANTRVGRQAARNERLVGASGWWQGGGRVETLPAYWMAMGGVILLCCWDASHWQMAFVMMCWMW